MSLQSKGGILSKACDYIRELRQSNQRLQESLKEVERIQVDNELCRQQVGLQAKAAWSSSFVVPQRLAKWLLLKGCCSPSGLNVSVKIINRLKHLTH